MAKTLYVPKYLSDEQKSIWRALVPVLIEKGKATHEDQPLLEQLCISWAEVQYAEQQLRDKGYTISSVNKQGGTYTQPSPYVAIRDRAFDRFLKIADRFGMSPIARKNIKEAGVQIDPVKKLEQLL